MRLDVVVLVLLMGSLKSVLAGSPDLLHALKFLKSGWVALPGLLQELKRTDLRMKIKSAELHARLKYVHSAYTWMDKQFLQPQWRMEDICEVPNHEARERRIRGMKFVDLQQFVEDAVSSLKQCKDIVEQKNSNVTFPYFQSLNLHRLDHEIYALATSRKLGRMAAILLQEPKVSLYQTAMFLQSASGGIARGTSWHRDLNMVPLGEEENVS